MPEFNLYKYDPCVIVVTFVFSVVIFGKNFVTIMYDVRASSKNLEIE